MIVVAQKSGFGKQLRRLREAAGLTQYALAKQSGVTEPGIAYLESEQREPTWPTVLKLAKALGVSAAAFEVAESPAEDEPEPPPPKRKPKKK